MSAERKSEQGLVHPATEVYCTRSTMDAMAPVRTLQELLENYLPDSEFVIEPQKSNIPDRTDFVFKIPRQHYDLVASIWRSEEFENYSWNVAFEKDQDVVDKSYQKFESFIDSMIDPKQPK